MELPAVPPDTKDWTFVTHSPCAQCGFDPAGVAVTDLPHRIRRNAEGWAAVLADPTSVRTRPTPQVWSPLEYAGHVRDVHRIFGERVRLMVETDDPLFPNWDQDVAAAGNRYADQDPAAVAADIAAGAAAIADRFAAVEGAAWQRPGRRSNGSVFTVETLGRYFLHDLEHHLWDVTGAREP